MIWWAEEEEIWSQDETSWIPRRGCSWSPFFLAHSHLWPGSQCSHSPCTSPSCCPRVAFESSCGWGGSKSGGIKSRSNRELMLVKKFIHNLKTLISKTHITLGNVWEKVVTQEQEEGAKNLPSQRNMMRCRVVTFLFVHEETRWGSVIKRLPLKLPIRVLLLKEDTRNLISKLLIFKVLSTKRDHDDEIHELMIISKSMWYHSLFGSVWKRMRTRRLRELRDAASCLPACSNVGLINWQKRQ